MAQVRLEFVIKPDGTVEERTLGLLGDACERETAQFEAELGEVLSREATADRYAAQAETRTDSAQRARLDE